MVTDWGEVRCQFPALANFTFLNTATYGQIPRRASEAVAQHLAHRDEFASDDFLTWFDDADRLRESISRLISCEAADVAFVPNASIALATVLNGLDWRSGDRIVTLAGEFPNNLYAPAVVGQGVSFCETEPDELYTEIRRGARLVVVSSANYATGFRPPLAELSKITHEHGALLYVDGTQTIGALQFDCRAIKADFVGVDGYKWLLCPNGAGFLYVRPEARSQVRPTVVGWRSDRRWRGVNALHHGAPEFVDAAERYEGGMLDFPALYGMAASVDLLLEIGAEKIEKRVLILAKRCQEILERHGGFVLHGNTAILAARFEGIDPSVLTVMLRERRILVSARHGCLRVSTHFYNDQSDLAALDVALGEECVRRSSV
jgi:cysteine desulfurase / selenocysteine lyase